VALIALASLASALRSIVLECGLIFVRQVQGWKRLSSFKTARLLEPSVISAWKTPFTPMVDPVRGGLAVSLTTVSVHLRVALDKLGIRRWEHAVLAGAIIMEGGASAVESGSGAKPGPLGADEQLAIAKVELCPGSLAELTFAEREVTLLVVDGLTNAEIGVQRNSSPRTVANQIAAVFRKLDVHGRLELIRRLALRQVAATEPKASELPAICESAPPLRSVADVPAPLPLMACPPSWPELTTPA